MSPNAAANFLPSSAAAFISTFLRMPLRSPSLPFADFTANSHLPTLPVAMPVISEKSLTSSPAWAAFSARAKTPAPTASPAAATPASPAAAPAPIGPIISSAPARCSPIMLPSDLIDSTGCSKAPMIDSLTSPTLFPIPSMRSPTPAAEFDTLSNTAVASSRAEMTIASSRGSATAEFGQLFLARRGRSLLLTTHHGREGRLVHVEKEVQRHHEVCVL